MAAATALDVSQPTVWKQVHALEELFGEKLVQTHKRGCHLTDAGRLLVEMAGPSVESIAALRERFVAALKRAGTRLTIAVPPRALRDDLAACVRKFCSRSPTIRFTFLEMLDSRVANAVKAQQADFGFSPTEVPEDLHPLVISQPMYDVEVRLVTPKNHPLARRRTIRPRDLRAFPFVNSPTGFFPSRIRAVLNQSDAYRPEQSIVQADYAATIRRFVELGFGIGLIHAVPSIAPHGRLHERPMSRYFGYVTINLIQRRGAFLPAPAETFIDFVRRELNSG